jgi:RNA polymerase sigma factor (TIGR02999 family)
MPADAVPRHEITGLLRAWEEGRPGALDRLIPLVYGHLKQLARSRKRMGDCGSVQTTSIVDEAYLRLVDLKGARWQDRAHFYALSARIMRAILVDAARARRARKRGGQPELQGGSRIDLDQMPDMGSGRADEILAIHEALEQLGRLDPRQEQVVEMRFFAGLTVEEAGAVLRVSPQTVMRDWKLAKVWLRRQLRRNGAALAE